MSFHIHIHISNSYSHILHEIRRVRESTELFLHGWGQDCNIISLKFLATNYIGNSLDWTGVNTGVTLVNS